MSDASEWRDRYHLTRTRLDEANDRIKHLEKLNELRLDAIATLWAGCLAQGVDLGPELTKTLKGQIGEERVASVISKMLEPTLNRDRRRKAKR